MEVIWDPYSRASRLYMRIVDHRACMDSSPHLRVMVGLFEVWLQWRSRTACIAPFTCLLYSSGKRRKVQSPYSRQMYFHSGPYG